MQSPQAIRKATLLVRFWWERKKPAAELPSLHALECLLQQPAGAVSAVLQEATGTPGLQDLARPGKQSRQAAVLLRDSQDLKTQQNLLKEIQNPTSI